MEWKEREEKTRFDMVWSRRNVHEKKIELEEEINEKAPRQRNSSTSRNPASAELSSPDLLRFRPKNH